jgi:hypothetical protein
LKINQQVAVNEQPGIQTNSSNPMLLLLDQLALCLVPQIDRDKAIEMKTLVHNYLVCYPKPVSLSFLSLMR